VAAAQQPQMQATMSIRGQSDPPSSVHWMLRQIERP
jgi:hypothetical protein